jgi:hypothetical protein
VEARPLEEDKNYSSYHLVSEQCFLGRFCCAVCGTDCAAVGCCSAVLSVCGSPSMWVADVQRCPGGTVVADSCVFR